MPCHTRTTVAHPDSCDEGSLEVVGDADEEGLPARDHGHAGGEVPHHVVRCQVHTVDVRVQREILNEEWGEEEEGGGRGRGRLSSDNKFYIHVYSSYAMNMVQTPFNSLRSSTSNDMQLAKYSTFNFYAQFRTHTSYIYKYICNSQTAANSATT